MAELLIKAINASHPDPVKDRRGCYKRGDIVVVMPDGHEWGAKEGLPNFFKVKIPGVEVSRLDALREEQDDDDAGNPVYEDGTLILADGPIRKVFRRRRWRLMVASIPATLRNKILNTGEATVTPAQIRNYIKRIRDNTTFGEL